MCWWERGWKGWGGGYTDSATAQMGSSFVSQVGRKIFCPTFHSNRGEKIYIGDIMFLKLIIYLFIFYVLKYAKLVSKAL